MDLRAQVKADEVVWANDNSKHDYAGQILWTHKDMVNFALAQIAKHTAQYKRLYDLRGQALRRPCLACGHVPAIISAQSTEVE